MSSWVAWGQREVVRGLRFHRAVGTFKRCMVRSVFGRGGAVAAFRESGVFFV